MIKLLGLILLHVSKWALVILHTPFANTCSKSITNILEQGPGTFPANIYLFKVNNRNTKKREKCSKLTRKIQSYWRRSGVFIVNF